MSSLRNHTRRRRTTTTSSNSYYSTPLTYTTSNSGEVWKVRTNELAKEEIKRDRKLAFESGKLKGRRLFEGESEEYPSVFREVINVEKGDLSSCLAKYCYNECGEMEEDEVIVKEVMNEEHMDIGVIKFDGFTVFDQLKNKLLTRRLATKNTVSESSPQALSASTAFLLGALSKSIATVLTYPAIRCKVMIQAAGGEEEKSTQTRKTRKTVSGVFYNIWKHEGILGYFKGLQAQILKTVISSALLLMIKEKITKSTWVLMLALRKSLFVTATKLKSA
ncbi:hypothetical protein KSS87_018741 [Heliosperma pusillum]|nr:hypothetical protein KSS87_018741 [Heliosperma pusillum]